MEKLLKFKKFYDHFEEYVVVTLVAVTTLLIFYQVVMRYVFNSSPAWSEELARFMFVWESWLGVSLTEKYGKHIKIEALIGRLSGKKLAAITIASDIVTMIILAIIVKFGVDLMNIVLNIHMYASATHIPMWIVYFACPLSCALMFIRLIGSLKTQIDVLRNNKEMEVI